MDEALDSFLSTFFIDPYVVMFDATSGYIMTLLFGPSLLEGDRVVWRSLTFAVSQGVTLPPHGFNNRF